jgi:hypothetical protein
MYVVIEPIGLKGRHLLYLESVYHKPKFWRARWDRPTRPMPKPWKDWPPTRESWRRQRHWHPALSKRMPIT